MKKEFPSEVDFYKKVKDACSARQDKYAKEKREMIRKRRGKNTAGRKRNNTKHKRNVAGGYGSAEDSDESEESDYAQDEMDKKKGKHIDGYSESYWPDFFLTTSW